MYNLSPRWRKCKGSTPDSLGPNNYDYLEKAILPNRTPFLSTTARRTDSAPPVYCHEIYDGAIKSRIIGGSSMRNRAPRSKADVDNIPSPSDYDPKVVDKKSFRASAAPSNIKRKKLYVCRVPYTIGASGPSIPTKMDVNGYDYDEKGRLFKIPADEYDESTRTAFYDVPTIPCLTTRLYKGCRWSLSRTRRGELIKDDGGPGPAAYDARYKKRVNDDDEYFREMARLYSYQPRYLDMIQKEISRNDYPGPGSYNLSTALGQTRSLSLNPAGFGSSAERPGLDAGLRLSDPAKYDVGKSFLLRSVSIKDVPFSVDSLRFPAKQKITTPGPAEYDPIGDGIGANLQRVMCSLTDYTPPFNHSAERNTLHISPDALATPGPNRYLVEKKRCDAGGDGKRPRDGSVFKSVTGRFEDRRRVAKSAEPATYSVSEPFNRSRNRKSHNVGRVPFQTAAPRRSTTGPSSFYAPDPCKYTSQPVMEFRGYSFNKTERFGDEGETPGPANYYIHPSQGQSTYKAFGTFNIRLQEHVLRSNLFETKLKTGSKS